MDKMIRLGVNIDHCATVRQARYREYDRTCGEIVEPDPVALAVEAERAGADGITVHPREDARHIQREDVVRLRQVLQIPLNMEMAATEEMVEFAERIQPKTVCLVPEKREEVSTEGGLDVAAQVDRLKAIVRQLSRIGVDTSLFIDPEEKQIKAASQIGAKYIELHTGSYANGWYTEARSLELERLIDGARLGNELGLIVNLGHGINYTNIMELREIEGIHEMNIGHSILSRALFRGISEAVREMRLRMNKGRW